MTSAVQVFREKFSTDIVGRGKILAERTLLRRLNRTDSAFVQVEVMHTLTIMDPYQYFKSYVPELILKMDHYDSTVSTMSYQSLKDIGEHGNTRAWQARIVFNTLRKNLFLSRNKLASLTEPDQRIKDKIDLVRWALKILGSQEIPRLPKEVINWL